MELFFKYLQFEKRFSPHTLTSYKTDLKQFSAYLAQTYHIDNPAEADHTLIRSWIITLIQKKLDARSVNRKIACLRSYYRFLVRQGIIVKNPTVKVVAPKVSKKLPSFISQESINQLLDGSGFEDNYEGLREKLILELLYGTGIRLAELIGLKQQDVDLASRTLKVTGKGNKERIIPINDNLYLCLQRYLETKKSQFPDNPPLTLFVTNKTLPLYPKFVYRVVQRYIGLISTARHKSPHILRHSFATHLLNQGADLNAIKDLLGHASLAATQVYTHTSIEQLKSIFDKAHPKA
jgi:integrase/recombinase XerC